MWIRGKSIRMRTMLAVIAAFAFSFALIRQAAIWYETRDFITFHEQRARWLREKAAQFGSDRADFAGDFRRYGAWHDERAVFYRRAHKTYFSDELIEDFRQTEREQAIEHVMYASSHNAATRLPAATKPR
jgi:hypothetical protein